MGSNNLIVPERGQCKIVESHMTYGCTNCGVSASEKNNDNSLRSDFPHFLNFFKCSFIRSWNGQIRINQGILVEVLMQRYRQAEKLDCAYNLSKNVSGWIVAIFEWHTAMSEKVIFLTVFLRKFTVYT